MFELQKPKKQDDDAIIVENVSKRFRIPHEKKTKLFEHIKGAIMGMCKLLRAGSPERLWLSRLAFEKVL